MSDNFSAGSTAPADVSATAAALDDALIKIALERAAAEREEAEEFRENTKVYTPDGKKRLRNISVYAVLLFGITVAVYAAVRMVTAFIATDYTRLCSPYLLDLALLLSIASLVVSSAWDYWNYHSRKRRFIVLISVISTLCFAELIYILLSALVVPLLLIPEPNQWVTESKWMFLIRCATIMPTLVVSGFFAQGFWRFAFDRFVMEDICSFRIMNHIDLRKNRDTLYDAKIIRYMKNGRQAVVRENDRYLHWLINGATGTAKTSSILIPMINGDLKTRCHNEDIQKKAAWDLLRKGRVRMNRPVTDRNFDLDAFTALDDDTLNLIVSLKKKYRKCGITVIGPDDSLSDAAFRLCETKNIPCNRVDPIPESGTGGENKKGFIGFNPLYVSPSIPEWQRGREIIKRATLFADVMQSINELKGKGDPYFTSINRSLTVAFSVCLCVTFPILKGRQPNPSDVQEMVNDFSRVKPYYEKLKQIYDSDRVKNDIYGFAIDCIGFDVVGPGADKMMEQARGLRMMMNEFLTNPLIRRTLCVDEEHTVDMDRMLAEGQITVVNYALQLGAVDSQGFGLFFLLAFFDSVYRRNCEEGSDILPHFLIIDELPVIIHPNFERAVSLFRKYKVGLVGCCQSLDQMAKNETTKYLTNVLMSGCAHHSLFGRCGADEMKRYSELAGKEWVVQEQVTQSETSLTDEDPTLSYSVRESLQQQESLEGVKIRKQQFQEITMFTVVNSNIVPPYFGKVSFLSNKEKNWMDRPTYHWDNFYRSFASADELPDSGLVASALKDLSTDTSALADNMDKKGSMKFGTGESGTETSDYDFSRAAFSDAYDDDDDDDFVLSSGCSSTVSVTEGRAVPGTDRTSHNAVMDDVMGEISRGKDGQEETYSSDVSL